MFNFHICNMLAPSAICNYLLAHALILNNYKKTSLERVDDELREQYNSATNLTTIRDMLHNSLRRYITDKGRQKRIALTAERHTNRLRFWDRPALWL